MQDICESKLIPSRKVLHDYDSQELALVAYINILSLRILLYENETEQFAIKFCKKTVEWGNFNKWRANGTDLYAMLYGLISDEIKLDKKVHTYRVHMPIDPLLVYRWIKSESEKHHSKEITNRLFVKLDSMLRIQDSSLRAIRRLVMEWDEIDVKQRRLALTRLLQFMRTRSAKGELLPMLNKVAVFKNLEIMNVENPETGEKKENLLKTFENASAGSSSAGNIATVVGGLGAGFDSDYSRSVYPEPKQKSTIIKRINSDSDS